MKLHRLLLFLFLPILFLDNGLFGQGLTGRLSGTVGDSSGALVVWAEVSVTNLETTQIRSTRPNEEGYYAFNELLPGNYRLTISAAGFKKYEQKSVSITAAERATLPIISLEVGGVNETISVSAEAVRLQTESAERSGLINTRQMQELPLKGRRYIGTAKLLPGVTDTVNCESPCWNDLVGININGTRAGTVNLTLDGITSLDTGSMVGPYLAPILDAVAEVKVLTSNYQAEYSRSSGGTINTVIKSGSRDLRGGAYYFFRNEAMNANEFFNINTGPGGGNTTGRASVFTSSHTATTFCASTTISIPRHSSTSASFRITKPQWADFNFSQVLAAEAPGRNFRSHPR